MTGTEYETKQCQACLEENDCDADICEFCGASLVPILVIDPEFIYQTDGPLTQGWEPDGLLPRKPKLFPLLFIWCMILPPFLVVSLLGIPVTIYDRQMHWFGRFIFFWIEIGLVCMISRYLYLITKSYFVELNLYKTMKNRAADPEIKISPAADYQEQEDFTREIR